MPCQRCRILRIESGIRAGEVQSGSNPPREMMTSRAAETTAVAYACATGDFWARETWRELTSCSTASTSAVNNSSTPTKLAATPAIADNPSVWRIICSEAADAGCAALKPTVLSCKWPKMSPRPRPKKTIDAITVRAIFIGASVANGNLTPASKCTQAERYRLCTPKSLAALPAASWLWETPFHGHFGSVLNASCSSDSRNQRSI